jgi:hypothetical protein
VPELATYLLITFFPQLPFVLYLAYAQPVRFPVDPVLGTFMLIFLVSSIFSFLNYRPPVFKYVRLKFSIACDTFCEKLALALDLKSHLQPHFFVTISLRNLSSASPR